MNLAEGIYVPLIQYLRIMKDVNPLSELHRKLLFSIFQYLTLLCYNYLEAKQILMEFIPEVLPFIWPDRFKPVAGDDPRLPCF